MTGPTNSSLNYITGRDTSKLLYNIALHIIYNRGSPWPGRLSNIAIYIFNNNKKNDTILMN